MLRLSHSLSVTVKGRSSQSFRVTGNYLLSEISGNLARSPHVTYFNLFGSLMGIEFGNLSVLKAGKIHMLSIHKLSY
jgi:hypothetical protein